MESITEQGYLVLADISGYTSFLAQSELDHAHDILQDLLEVVASKMDPPLIRIVVEGDAVFAYAPAVRTPNGETVLEVIDATYLAFRDRVTAIRQRTTCECRACAGIPSLDLKFVVHFGTYIARSMAGEFNLLGSDVNLAHRLLKNHVVEEMGWRAYVLLTEAALERVGLPLEGLHEGRESYEHLGETRIFSFDIHPRYEMIARARRMVVTPEEADITFSVEMTAPPPVVWEWLNDPGKRCIWQEARVSALERPGGRHGPGARTHCDHGKNALLETILDWKPFDYYTSEGIQGRMTVLMPQRLKPLQGGTQLTCTMQCAMPPMPRALVRPMSRRVVKREIIPRYHRMAELAAQDAAARETPVIAGRQEGSTVPA